MKAVFRKLKPFLKAVTAGGATIAYGVTAALSDETVTNAEWVSLFTLLMVTAGVFQVPNKPEFDADRKLMTP